MLTKVDTKGKFPNLKPKQRKLAEMLCDPDNDMTITAICKELKVSRQTFYNWQKNMSFNGYVEFLIDSFTDSELPRAWKTLIKRAVVDGNIEALKLFFSMKDKYKEELNVKGNVVFIGGEDDIKK